MKILGIQFGKKPAVQLKATPATAVKNQRASKAIKKQYKRSAAFQIADIKSALLMAQQVDTPNRKRIFEIYEYILKDGHIKSQIKMAKIKVSSEPWLLYSSSETPDLNLTKALSKRWFNSIIEYILEAEFYGFTLLELNEIDPANFMVHCLTSIDREYVSIENQWILIEGTINGSYLPYGDIMQEIDLLEFGRHDDYGCLLECAYNIIFKFYSRSDWSRGSEKFGMPILNIEADTNDDTELDRLETAAANFGTDGYIITQKGDKATIVERQGQKLHDIWFDNIKYCDEQVSKIINGQTASSDPKAFVGAAQVQERTMEDFTLSRLQNVADEMNEKILPYLRLKGFAIPDDMHFDYPTLIRDRKKKIEGPMIPAATDPIPAPDPTKKEPNKPNQKPKR
jgi:phage gp29-like protein